MAFTRIPPYIIFWRATDENSVSHRRSLPQDLVHGPSIGQFIHQLVPVTDLLHAQIEFFQASVNGGPSTQAMILFIALGFLMTDVPF
jgi:hypothetical protein